MIYQYGRYHDQQQQHIPFFYLMADTLKLSKYNNKYRHVRTFRYLINCCDDIPVSVSPP